MAEDLYRNINTNRVEILKHLDLEITITNELRSKDIISHEQAELLLDDNVPDRKKNSLFIRYLERKSPSQIKGFCKVLQEYGQAHVSQLITDSACPTQIKQLPVSTVSQLNTDLKHANMDSLLLLLQRALNEKVQSNIIARQLKGRNRHLYIELSESSEELASVCACSPTDSDRISKLEQIVLAELVAAGVITEEQAARIAQKQKLILRCCFCGYPLEEENSSLMKIKRLEELASVCARFPTVSDRMNKIEQIILAELVAAEVITEEEADKIAEKRKLNLLQCFSDYPSEEEISSFMKKLQKTLQLHNTEKQKEHERKSAESEMVKKQCSRESVDNLDDIKHHNSMKLAREIVKEDIIQKDKTNTDPSEKSPSPLMKDIDLNTLCATVLSRAKRVVMHGPRDSESVISALAAEWASITEDIVVLDNQLQQETELGEYLKKFDLTVTLDIENNHNKSLSDVILEEHPRMRNVDNFMSRIEKNQSKVLFLIKGYDKSRLDPNSDIQRLLNREILPDATCIVSTTDQFPGYKTSWSDKEILVEDYLHKHTQPDEETFPVWMKPKKSSKDYIQNFCIEDIQYSHRNRVSRLKQSQQTMKLYDVCFSGSPSRVLTVDPEQAPAQGLFIDTIAVDWALYWQFMKRGKSVENILDKAAEHLLNYDICLTLDLHDVTSDQTLVEIIKSQHPKLEELEDLEEFLEENQNKTLFLVKGLNTYITKGMYNSDINKLFEKSLLPDVVCVLAYRGQVRRSAFHWGRCVQLTEDQVDICRSNGKGRKRRSVGSVFCAVEMDAKKPRN